MSTSNNRPRVTNSSTGSVLLWASLALVAFAVGIVAANIYLGIAFAALAYFVVSLRKRVKTLEERLRDIDGSKEGAESQSNNNSGTTTNNP